MTALSQYQRLEATGLWRDRPGAQRREVLVVFGDASLVLSDGRSEAPLAHWSLPAVTRRNPGEMPAVYAPNDDETETLELADEMMIGAIEKVHRLLEARRPRPGRLRTSLLAGALAAVLALGVFWLPGGMVRHAARIVPDSKRLEIGQMVLADLERVLGASCTEGAGPEALARLGDRVQPGAGGRFAVLPGAFTSARQLPGTIIVLGHDLVEDFEAPEVAAGHMLAARLHAEAIDPLTELLNWAGFVATFRLLTTGDLSPQAVQGYGEALLAADPAAVDDQALLARFAAAGIASSPYAFALDPSGETVLGLIEADPYRSIAPKAPVLPPPDWAALQAICGG